MSGYDPGPPPAVAEHLERLPSYAQYRELFWYDWGPVFYRGRLDGSARVLGIASDPGPTERIAGRTLVGDAGQRVQGFLAKLGLSRSYVLVNAYAYALIPSRSRQVTALLRDPAHRAWQDRLLDLVTGPQLQAVVTFGVPARTAYELWSSAPDVPVEHVPHPSSRDTRRLLDEWRAASARLRDVVTPDPDRVDGLSSYGDRFEESDFAAIPRADLPFGVPVWLGDDAAGRRARPIRRNSVERDADDPLHTLVWRAPVGPE